MFSSHIKPCSYTMARHKANSLFRVDVFLDGPGGDLSSTHHVFGTDIDAETAMRFISNKYCGDWGFKVIDECFDVSFSR